MRIVQITLGLVFFAVFSLGSVPDIRSQTGDPEPQWETYGSDLRGVEHSYDKKSIVYPSDDILVVRRQRVFPPGSTYRKIINLDEIDCKKQKYRSLEITATGKDGSVQDFKKVSEWTVIYQDMPEDYFLIKHCK